MLKYNFVRLAFLFLLLLGLAGSYFMNWPWWPLVLLFVLYSGIVAYGSYQIQWNFHLDSIHEIPKSKNAVALTFDDGPVIGKTEEILKILAKHQVKATFFFIGNRAAKQPELAKKVFDEGHLIGNHSHNHTFWFDLYSTKKMGKELELCNQTIEKIIGKKARLFRPPYGVTTPNMSRVLKTNGMYSIGWTLRSLDTVIKDKTILLEKLNQTKLGDIILLHDTGHQTVSVLDEFLTDLNRRKIPVKRLDELIGINYE